MNVLQRLNAPVASETRRFGGKAVTLARLEAAGLPTPESYALPVDVYREFIVATGVADLIRFELGRKDFAEMRWEEVWDASLRIRSHFMTASWPPEMVDRLRSDLEDCLPRWQAAAVRSTAPGEDSAQHSFAGLHESRVQLVGVESCLTAIRAVWASLWSDSALLYRQELGLDPARSAMAILVQEMVVGDRSGILFTASPLDPDRMMAEAVWGLNQALVDGTLSPERWELARDDGRVVAQETVAHTEQLVPTEAGPALRPLPEEREGRPVLDDARLRELYHLGREVEILLSAPADIEWTCRDGRFVLLQARPITTGLDAEDPRTLYQGLHLSLPRLERLRDELEQEVLPGMLADAERFAAIDLESLDDEALAATLDERYRVNEHWVQTYHDKCIPMAHGLRLFGSYYNERMQPDEPYAFVDLLRSDDLLAVKRNRRLQELADLVRNDPTLRRQLRADKRLPEIGPFAEACAVFRNDFGGFDWVSGGGVSLCDWLLHLAERTPVQRVTTDEPGSLVEQFIDRLNEDERLVARRMLAVARASYALRDNDNLHIGRVREQLQRAEVEVRRRLAADRPTRLHPGLLKETSPADVLAPRRTPSEHPVNETARQLVGQPAVAGLASGPARVVGRGNDLRNFETGDVLVCDAIEPNMTFLVPLAAAIVERRGGMLIHGAIIAREYGIPCVTGIPGATVQIRTGDRLAVDGYLGIVTIDRQTP